MRRFVIVVALAACGGSSKPDQMDAPPLTGDKFSLQWGPLTVDPGKESTQCIWLRLGNDTEIKVHQMHNVLSVASHHLIVYRDDSDMTEQTTPTPCQPFTGALNTTGTIFPMMITQKHDDELSLPDAVAYTLAPHQMIKIEMHYINTTDAAVQAMASVDLFSADPATIKDEANILFIGTPDVSLPPGAVMDIHEFFTPSHTNLDLSQAKFFAITGHTHHLGTDVKVNVSDSPTGSMKSVYAPDPFLWSEPLTEVHKPEFTVPAGSTSGFDFTCSYNNTTAATVKFGESANDEMCFFWAYYYPSNGSHVCVHTTQFGNLDLCCPDAGPTVCNRITGM